MSDVRYREATADDSTAIVEFQLAMARETEDLELDRVVLTRGVAAVFADPSLGRYFVAESVPRFLGASVPREDGNQYDASSRGTEEPRHRGTEATVVASLMITYEWSDWRSGMVWWIQSVYVTPEFRRRGVYAGLYSHVKSFVDGDPAIRGIRLYVDERNKPAQEVYARLGMNGEHYRVFEWMK